ncbi:hypothetical protein ACFL2V_20195 [Pseudomonadota bacterium]
MTFVRCIDLAADLLSSVVFVGLAGGRLFFGAGSRFSCKYWIRKSEYRRLKNVYEAHLFGREGIVDGSLAEYCCLGTDGVIVHRDARKFKSWHGAGRLV